MKVMEKGDLSQLNLSKPLIVLKKKMRVMKMIKWKKILIFWNIKDRDQLLKLQLISLKTMKISLISKKERLRKRKNYFQMYGFILIAIYSIMKLT